MRIFEFESMNEAYPQLLKALLEEGEEVSPRGMLTKEISPTTIVITNPRNRVLNNPLRKLNYGFMVGELFWILQGKNDLTISHYNKNWENFSDDGKYLNGAYGQRIFKWDGLYDIYETNEADEEGNTHPQICVDHIVIDQFENAYEQLKADPDSRQASIVLFNPVQDYRKTKDKPCTNLMRFSIRNGKLNMLVLMRSNDIWYGTPYDIFNFTMLQEIMAGKLGVEVGKYTHIADSLHIYEEHFKNAQQIVNANNNYPEFNFVDARISNDKLENMLTQIFRIENNTRTMEDTTAEQVVELLNNVENPYWQSLAAVIATYNFKKFKKNSTEIETIKSYIVNEFKELF